MTRNLSKTDRTKDWGGNTWGLAVVSPYKHGAVEAFPRVQDRAFGPKKSRSCFGWLGFWV